MGLLDNPLHIIFILVVLLLVFGAKRLPEIGRSLGEGLRGFKDSLSGESQRETITPAAPVVPPVPTAAIPAAAPVPPVAAPVPAPAPPAEQQAAPPPPAS